MKKVLSVILELFLLLPCAAAGAESFFQMGDAVLAIKEDDSLWQINSEKAEKLADGIKTMKKETYGYSDKYAVGTDGSLYLLENGEKTEVLRNVDESKICGDNYAISEDGSLWRLEGAAAFKLLDDVKSEKSGSNGMFAITNGGTLYSWGDDAALLGRGEAAGNEPGVVLEGVKEIKQGKNLVFALCEDGSLWGWGRNYINVLRIAKPSRLEGILGVETEGEAQYTPIKIAEGIKSIETIGFYSAAVTFGGELLCWGYNNYLQMPNATEKYIALPTVLSEGVKSVALYDFYMFVEYKSGELNLYGQTAQEDSFMGIVSTSSMRPNASRDITRFLENDVKEFLPRIGYTTWERCVKVLKNNGKFYSFSWPLRWKDGASIKKKELIDNDVEKIYDEDIYLKKDGSLWGYGVHYNECMGNKKEDDYDEFERQSSHAAGYSREYIYYNALYAEYKRDTHPHEPVKLLDNVVAVMCRYNYCCYALTADGSLWDVENAPEKISDGVKLPMETLKFEVGDEAYIKNDRVMVPMRAIFEAMGATVTWDDEEKCAIGERDGVTVKIKIGEAAIYKNGEKTELDSPAEIVDDRTMVPVRAIAEAFGASVDWDNETRCVIITE